MTLAPVLFLLMPMLALTGMGLYLYGTDHGWRYKLAGVLLFVGGPSGIAAYADWRASREPPPRDPWVCTHTHVETQCRGMMLHTCGPVDVCDEKHLVP